MSNSLKKLCLTALGIALFPALAVCLQVPVFENYYLCLGYAAMAVWLWCFGTLSGTLVGALGVVIYCLIINGMRGMPGWALGNVVIGLILGPVFLLGRRIPNRFLRSALWIAAIAVSSALGILVVKSLTECLLYQQPFALRVGKNVYAFVADLVMLVVSIPLCRILYPVAKKRFPELTR